MMREASGWGIGIDPGSKGAVAIVGVGGWCAIYDAEESGPALAVYRAVMTVRRKAPAVTIEQVHAMPGQGVTGVFSFGRAYGEALGALAVMGVTTDFVSPQRWKKHFELGREKYASLELARELFPYATEAGLLKLKKHHDRAEALLIAEYGRRMVTRGSE